MELKSNTVSESLLGLSVVSLLLAIQLFRSMKPKGTKAVIIEGRSDLIGSYFSAYHFLNNAKAILQACYRKHGKSTFKVAEIEQWSTVVNKPELIEEIRKAPDDRFSFQAAAMDFISSKYTLGMDFPYDSFAATSYHIAVVRNQLTRSLTSKFGDVCDEIIISFKDLIPKPVADGEWVGVNALETMRDIVCRASNRIFVGLPLCRDKSWIDLSVRHTIEIMERAQFLRKIPMLLRPIVGNYMYFTDPSLKRAIKMLKPILEDRFKSYDATGGDWEDKPVDLISWLMDTAPPEDARDIEQLTKRILFVVFVAIHTSSNTFVHALLHLAAEPKYAEPIREEVERVIKEDGWTKVAMTKMRKLDSFLKESHRMNGIGIGSLNRKAMQDTVLSDGTFIPKGSVLIANMVSIHSDPSIYPEPDTFKPWRFSEMRESSVDEANKHQSVNTSSDYLGFGHGRHACPGRFFAVNELKAMMAYIVMNYDVRTEVEGVRPPNMYVGLDVAPDAAAKVFFRKKVPNVH